MFLTFLLHLGLVINENKKGVSHPWRKENNEEMEKTNPEAYNRKKTLAWILGGLLVVQIFLCIVAIVTALGCNSRKRTMLVTLACIFPEFYLAQNAYRRYIKMEPYYCTRKNEMALASPEVVLGFRPTKKNSPQNLPTLATTPAFRHP
jgi:hypothetical protein